MKKLFLTIAIVLGLGLTTFADPDGGGLFKRGMVIDDEEYYGAGGYRDGMLTPGLPLHNQEGNQDAPLGTGIAVLAALGGAYLLAKKRREE